MQSISDILEFSLGGNKYAMDIQLTREIVETLPITAIPKSPEYIAGMTNIRGEITTIVSIEKIIGASIDRDSSSKKFIIFTPESARGNNLGMIVDEVYSVLQIGADDIEYFSTDSGSNTNNFIRGVISIPENEEDESMRDRSHELVLYLDIEKLINHLFDAV